VTEEKQIEWMPLPEGAKLEIGSRSEPVPLVGIMLHLGGGNRLAFAYSPAQAREIAASILEAADRLDREQRAGQN
jgi:hypothetical protein